MPKLTLSELDAMEAHVRETDAPDAPTRNVYTDILTLIEFARGVLTEERDEPGKYQETPAEGQAGQRRLATRVRASMKSWPKK